MSWTKIEQVASKSVRSRPLCLCPLFCAFHFSHAPLLGVQLDGEDTAKTSPVVGASSQQPQAAADGQVCVVGKEQCEATSNGHVPFINTKQPPGLDPSITIEVSRPSLLSLLPPAITFCNNRYS